MKKLVTLLIAITLTLSLSACGQQSEPIILDDGTQTTQSTTTTTSEITTTTSETTTITPSTTTKKSTAFTTGVGTTSRTNTTRTMKRTTVKRTSATTTRTTVTTTTKKPITTTAHIHDFNKGQCSSCGASDSNYKTPNLLLGTYIQQNGTKQSDGKYMISFEETTSDKKTITQFFVDPSDNSLLFAQQCITSIAVTTAGIIYEHGSNQQKITVINDQTATGVSSYKVTGIGYIYTNTYNFDSRNIYSYTCDVSSLATPNKRLAETCIYFLVLDIDEYLDANFDFDIKDFGFTNWPY